MYKVLPILLLCFTLLNCTETQTSEPIVFEEAIFEENSNNSINLEDPKTTIANNKLDHLSMTSETSDCYIIDDFFENKVRYITVDFITYEILPETAGTDAEEYAIINNNKKLRTFVVKEKYMQCSRSNDISIQDLLSTYKSNPKTIYNLEAVKGVITELYIDVCSG